MVLVGFRFGAHGNTWSPSPDKCLGSHEDLHSSKRNLARELPPRSRRRFPVDQLRVSASAMRMVHVPRSETKGEMRYSPSVSFSLERSSFTSRRCLELFATSFKSKASSRRLRFDTTTRSTTSICGCYVTPSNVLVLTAS